MNHLTELASGREKEDMARPSEQALVNEAATHLHPPGFDPSRVDSPAPVTLSLEQRLRDYAQNGYRSWQGIEAIFIEAADALKAKDNALRARHPTQGETE